MTSHATSASVIDIHPLSASRLNDFMSFFDSVAFTDNPRWSSCYCQCFYENHSVVRWNDRTAAQNRYFAEARIQSGAMQGLLAYHDGAVVGWCNAAPRRMLHALDDEPVDNVDGVGTILCFLVAPAMRGRGVATRLLEAACSHLKTQGMSIVEANPRTAAKNAAENHFGPLNMYVAAGFAIRQEDADGSVWVQRTL